jgi:hypothetical protein
MEVKFIWGSEDIISITNILFILNRYYPIVRAACYTFLSLQPPKGPNAVVSCTNWTLYNSWSTMANVATVESMLFLSLNIIAEVLHYPSPNALPHLGPLG